MSARFEFIDSLLKKNEIPLFALGKHYEANKDFVDTAIKIFDCKNEKDIALCSVIPELIIEDAKKAERMKAQLYENLKINEPKSYKTEDILELKLQIITAMYFNPNFFVYTMNWLYFLENDTYPTIEIIGW